MVPIHASFGVVTFMLAIATAVSGLTQKAHFELEYVYLPNIFILNVYYTFCDKENKKAVSNFVFFLLDLF